ncbi:MAG: hypothetical protein HGA80_08625 [Candidatus Omnitrophica bacterium]|nr:hypothetical protein [Candidatus Omnitrophota bacterium]
MALSEEQELDLDSQAAKLKNIDYKQRLAELGGKSWNISYDVFTDAVSSFLKSKDNDKLESARSSLRDAGFGNQQAIALASLISLSEDSLRSANWKGGHQSPIMSVLWHLTQQMPVDKVMEMVGGLDELAKWTQFLQEGTGKLEAWQATDRENAAAAEELIAKFDQVEGLPTENRIILAQAAKSLKDNGSEENAAIATVKSLWAQFSSLSNPDIRARAVLLAAGQLKASDQAQTRATNKTDKMATPTGGIDLGHGEYLKVTGTDASGMPKFDPVQILRLQKDLRGIVPVPVSGPQPVNLRPLFGLNPQAGKDDLQAGQLDPAKLESEDPAGV